MSHKPVSETKLLTVKFRAWTFQRPRLSDAVAHRVCTLFFSWNTSRRPITHCDWPKKWKVNVKVSQSVILQEEGVVKMKKSWTFEPETPRETRVIQLLPLLSELRWREKIGGGAQRPGVRATDFFLNRVKLKIMQFSPSGLYLEVIFSIFFLNWHAKMVQLYPLEYTWLEPTMSKGLRITAKSWQLVKVSIFSNKYFSRSVWHCQDLIPET